MNLSKRKKLKLMFLYVLTILWIAISYIGYSKQGSMSYIILITLAITSSIVNTIYIIKDISIFK